jgi:hypothetical protein
VSLPEIIIIDGYEHAKCQGCNTLVKLLPPGTYTNNSRDQRIRALQSLISKLSCKYCMKDNQQLQLKFAKVELEKLLKEKEYEDKLYHFIA